MSDDARRSVCDELAPDLSELALGVLPGRERARVLSHLDTCRRCATEVEALSQAADALLEVAPAVEPPGGFESRVFDRMAAVPSRRRPRRAQMVIGMAAVLVALGLAFGAGWLAAPGAPGEASAGARAPADAVLSSPQGNWGRVLLYQGQPGWMFMTVSAGGWSRPVTCQITLDDGSVVRIGTFDLTSGQGAWGVPLPVPAGQVRSARLVGQGGAVVATATFKA